MRVPPMSLLAIFVAASFGQDEPFCRVCLVSLRAETYAPVTTQSIWIQGQDVTRQVQPKRADLWRILRVAKKGRFDEGAVRLGISTPAGFTMYVDRWGGVGTKEGDRKLDQAHFAGLERLLPNLYPKVKPIRRGEKPPPGTVVFTGNGG